MKFVSVAEIAKKWNVSDRMVRNYCAEGRIPGAFQTGRTWNIPEDAVKPAREPGKQFSDNKLLNVLKEQKDSGLRGGIYHKTQIEFTYNSNHIEGSTLTHEQTRYIFETNTIGAENSAFNVDDVVETANHFKCVDYIIDNAKKPLSESMIKELHFILKNGTSDSRKNWFNVGEEFHKKFESIHPFQDGNGRIGRLIMFKECLMNDVVPFIIDEEHKWYYYRGLKEWNKEKGYLTGTCLSCQDKYKEWLMYFKIEY